ncbi:anaphase-promoting complex subunit 8 [Quercus suber]|uniref:Anaphase-promoting complex subunit 8 n=1 Tax=Quercus suber TaxID=58331 RepID=A0AAW0JUZ6_QUESU
MNSKESCRSELRIAIRQLSDRCLYTASKWAAEQLMGIEQDPANFTPSNTRFQWGSSSIRRRFRTNEITSTPIAGVSYVSTPVMEEDDAVDGDFYLLAKSYFDCREYRRAAHVLRDQTGKKSVFLRCYALYLAGEKRKEEEVIELEGPLGKSDSVNRELVSLERELSTLRKNGSIDPFGLAAEQLMGIEQDPANFTPSNTRFQWGSSSIRRRFRTNEITSTPIAGVSYVSTPVMEEDDAVDGDFYLLAKSYFDCREYRRAAHVLRDQTGKKSVFLRCYALYLAGEKRKEEEVIELEGPLGKSDSVNRELVSLERELSTLRKNGSIDPFGLYLYGLVLKEKGSENVARTVLVESVNSYPWNWNAWSELQSLCTTIDTLNSLNLNNHWMKDFFLASAYQEIRMHSESLVKYEYLQGTFGYSSNCKSPVQFEGISTS